jgi:hypothetical protein
MKYTVEMGSGAMIYVPSFIKVGSAIQKLIAGDTHTDTQKGDQISLLLFFQNKESWLKIMEFLIMQFPLVSCHFLGI